MDRVAVIRSIVGLRDEHSSSQSVTGYPRAQAQREGRPNFGSVIARVQGVVDPVVPPCFDLSPRMQHMPYNIPGPGFLGHAYKPARVEPDDLALLSPRPTCRRRGSIAARPCSASSTSSAAASTTPRSAAWTASTAAPSTC